MSPAWPGFGARAAVYAVVVGIDDYERMPKLTGAANDARDLAASLGNLGADVSLILNREATRQHVIEAFERQAGRAGPGDMFVFTYAGHGMQEPESIPGDEADGMDETLVFAGFDRSGKRAGERLRDNELGMLIARLNPEAQALILIDSCHSGTMTRDIDVRGRPPVTRFAGIGRISSDPLPQMQPSARGLDLASGANVVFVAAARDAEQIPEVEIDGVMHGAVSWTVARALQGNTEFGGPNMALSEFRTLVPAQARALSAARQSPSVNIAPLIATDSPVIPASALAGALPASAPQALAAPSEDRVPLIHAIGASPAPLPADVGRLTPDTDDADLIWDMQKGEVIDRAGADLVAEAWDEEQLAGVLTKWRAARQLRDWALRRHMTFRILPGDSRHRLGETVSLSVQRPEDGPAYLTIVNLASTGEVQFIYPAPAVSESGTDFIKPGKDEVSMGEFKVADPVGADHVVAIFSPQRATALHRWLETGNPDAVSFVARLRSLAHDGGYRIGVNPIFTTR
ncbi:caspase family protein [Oceanibacterium hippocampi]|uniref:Caspase domain protein n=1 Tax=Oceanibacterium hippocampi TaxID=745714 RepID=A0A1Y5TWU6_9PROT|nr:caspase family protein [Oceanibacterium hippocampi]SLN75727.1 Caspase domain protein [Oceanibacterium hippocampi]